MKFMKLFSNNLFLVTSILMLTLPSTGVFAMEVEPIASSNYSLTTDRPCDNTRSKSSLARDQEALSTDITTMVATYFTIEKLEQAKNDYLLSHETVSFIAKAQRDIPEFLDRSDRFFKNSPDFLYVPGYLDYKKHLLADIKRFSSCLGYGQDEVEAIKTSLSEKYIKLTLAKQSVLKSLESSEQPAHLSPESYTKRRNFTVKSPQSKNKFLLNISIATSPKTKKIAGGFLKQKIDYFDALLKLKEKSPLACKKFEHPEERLTLAIAYKEKLIWLKSRNPKNDAEIVRKKNEYRTMFYELALIDKKEAEKYEDSELGAILDHGQSSSTMPLYDAYALTLRGTLFESEGPLKAYEFGEEVLSLGTNVSLSFNTLNKKEVIKEIEKHPSYLHLTGDKTSAVRKLGQEYDAITKLRIIEFKCVNGTIKKYLPNLLRELFVAQKAQDASSSKIVAGSTALPCEIIAKKPVTCYVKYTTQEENGSTLADERAEAEQTIIKHGFSVWNGTTYSFSITDEFMITDKYYEHIDNVINKVGPKNCCIYVQDTLNLFKNAALDELASRNVSIIPFTKLEYKDARKRIDSPAGTEEITHKKQNATPTSALKNLLIDPSRQVHQIAIANGSSFILAADKSPEPNHRIGLPKYNPRDTISEKHTPENKE